MRISPVYADRLGNLFIIYGNDSFGSSEYDPQRLGIGLSHRDAVGLVARDNVAHCEGLCVTVRTRTLDADHLDRQAEQITRQDGAADAGA